MRKILVLALMACAGSLCLASSDEDAQRAAGLQALLDAAKASSKGFDEAIEKKDAVIDRQCKLIDEQVTKFKSSNKVLDEAIARKDEVINRKCKLVDDEWAEIEKLRSQLSGLKENAPTAALKGCCDEYDQRLKSCVTSEELKKLKACVDSIDAIVRQLAADQVKTIQRIGALENFQAGQMKVDDNIVADINSLKGRVGGLENAMNNLRQQVGQQQQTSYQQPVQQPVVQAVPPVMYAQPAPVVEYVTPGCCGYGCGYGCGLNLEVDIGGRGGCHHHDCHPRYSGSSYCPTYSYNAGVGAYNAAYSAYLQNPTQAGYQQMVAWNSNLQQQYSGLSGSGYGYAASSRVSVNVSAGSRGGGGRGGHR